MTDPPTAGVRVTGGRGGWLGGQEKCSRGYMHVLLGAGDTQTTATEDSTLPRCFQERRGAERRNVV